jgi:hypothetical protein
MEVCVNLTPDNQVVALQRTLQLRMSKKIAQLTKVIYHLNSRTEDHEAELAELAEGYEADIERILADTADKLEAYKAMADDARDQRHLHDMARVDGRGCGGSFVCVCLGGRGDWRLSTINREQAGTWGCVGSCLCRARSGS